MVSVGHALEERPGLVDVDGGERVDDAGRVHGLVRSLCDSIHSPILGIAR